MAFCLSNLSFLEKKRKEACSARRLRHLYSRATPVSYVDRQVPNARSKTVKTRVLRRAGEGVKAVATLVQDAAGLDRMRCMVTVLRSWITERSVGALLAFWVIGSALVLDMDLLADYVGERCQQFLIGFNFERSRAHGEER